MASSLFYYRREAEDNLRVPPRGADEDENHQFHSRGDDAATQYVFTAPVSAHAGVWISVV